MTDQSTSGNRWEPTAVAQDEGRTSRDRRLAGRHGRGLRRYLDSFWDASLVSFARAAESSTEGKGT